MGDAALAPLESTGVIGAFESQLVATAARAASADGSAVDGASLLALALVARATRLGHVCLDLERVRHQLDATRDDDGIAPEFVLPEPEAWGATLRASALVASEQTAESDHLLRPMVLVGTRLYLQRYWAFEVRVAAGLADRRRPHVVVPADASPVEATFADAPPAEVHAALDAVFGPDATPEVGSVLGADPDGTVGPVDVDQRRAAARALTYPVTVISGGPGTGKTHTVSRLLAAAHVLAIGRGEVLRTALAAPTGKAANRMRESIGDRVSELQAAGRIDVGVADILRGQVPTTIHRLLGARGRSGFVHDRDNPLPHDLIVVDETSMVSLPLLSRLIEAMRPGARLVFVGDPFQLTSIEAGTVMSDLVGPGDRPDELELGPLGGRVTELRRGFRFAAGSSTADLALAIRDGDGDRTMEQLSSGHDDVRWVRPDDRGALSELRDEVVDGARHVVGRALQGDGPGAVRAALEVKVLAAVRRGANGMDEWSALIADAVRGMVPVSRRSGWPQVGTPVMVTRNDPVNDVANGDVGVVVDDGPTSWIVLGAPDDLRRLAPARLGWWEPWWAMTIHKSQGSEFPRAVVALPAVDSPILTRELLYTAVTRGKPQVVVVGTEKMIRLAVSRPVARASGLRDRLWPGS